MTLTLTQAAAALSISPRTMRRMLATGAVSGRKVLHGQREVWAIDPAEVARYGEATGQSVTLQALLPGAEADKDLSMGGKAGGTAQAEGAEDPAFRDTAGAVLGDTEGEALRARIRELEAERDWLRDHVGKLTRLLPAPADSAAPQQNAVGRRGWWARLLNRGNREGNDG